MSIRFDRIRAAQSLMREQGWVGIMIMNHDDYRYFFGQDWAQPRAIIPREGAPLLISSAGEEPNLREYAQGSDVKVFTHVGEQMSEVIGVFRELHQEFNIAPQEAKSKVGMQMWFETPAFLVDLFRKLNPRLELVPSDPVMDALRSVKEKEEIELMTRAQQIATLGMDRAREMLRPGMTARQIATEALYVMLKAGAEGTSTPIYVNLGPYTCMLHGVLSPNPLNEGDLVVINLNPQVEGYCANLSRTFVLGEPDDMQRRLMKAYSEMVTETRKIIKPGIPVKDLDARGQEICAAHGFGDYHLDGISHGIGLRFEETPASTIIRQHRNVKIREGMTLTIGHTILAVPGVGGVRNEDVYQVTPDGAEILVDYAADWVVPCR
ncbi:MAG: aminopeptidase P family protein [Anaerolineae bacterium]|nr:aminopeptidase P family protein [Anaerolineae bacterium]